MISIEKQILFLMTRKEEMSVQELVQIYTRRGYREQSIRNVLSHLKKDDYIQATKRSHYKIADKGNDFLTSVNRKPSQYDQKWQGYWYVVYFEMPESERSQRDRFRSELIEFGFGQLYKGVYITPWDYREELIPLIESRNLSPYITITEAKMIFNEMTKERAAQVWPLREVHQLYLVKWKWYTEEFQPALQKQLQTKLDPLALFVLYLHIGEIISEIGLKDPMLPLDLLPDDWIGHKVIHEFYRSFQSFATIIPQDSNFYNYLV